MKHKPVLATVCRAFDFVHRTGLTHIPENMKNGFDRGASGISDHSVISYDLSSRRGV